MENYFLLLELPFDPPENDTAKIEAAIAKKKDQWAKDGTNPVKKTKALGYIEKLDDIKKVMFDPDSRKAEAAKAKEIKASKVSELDAKLKLYHAKGDTLAPKDLRLLVRQFMPFGFTQEEIQSRFAKKHKKPSDFNPAEIIDKSQIANITNYLKQLDMLDSTLYDFLDLPPTASSSQLRDNAENLKKKILAKGNKTAKDGAVQSLCGLCAVLFKDDAGKRKYDNYVSLTRYRLVNSSIDELAKSNQKKITPEMKEDLIDLAVSHYTIGVSDASIYINNYCAFMGYSLPENKIICGLCGAENPSSSTHCLKCGKPLIIICPSCGSENSNAAKTCAKCGFDLSKMENALELLAQAKEKYAVKDIQEADRLLKSAKSFWPNHADILALEKIIEEEREAGAKALATIMTDVQAKRMFAARTKIDQARAKGFTIDPAVSEQVNSILSQVEQKLAKMRAATGDEAFCIAMELSSMISDSEELNQSLKSFPPNPCERFGANQIRDSVSLFWEASTSTGDISYHVVRKEGIYPNNPNDGTEIYSGPGLSFTDVGIPSNCALYYCVFAMRLGVSSTPMRLSEPVALVEKVGNLKSIGGDTIVTLSWTKSQSVTEIQLGMCRSTQCPQNTSSFTPIPCSRLDGITINNLVNGENYWFFVNAGHRIEGKVYYSEPTFVSAVPQKPAKPLQDFRVNSTDTVFQASWKQSEWDVILFYANEKPEYAIGIIYALDELLGQYKKIDINLKSATEAEFHLNYTGECYIIPGVINASNVILNTAVYVSSVPSVKDVSFDLNSTSSEMYVNFTWPKKVDRSTLVYRMDTYPTSVNDPLAVRIDCSKRQYEANEGVLISKPAKGTYYAMVFTYYEFGERRIYSDGVRALLSNEPMRSVSYTFKYKKPKFFSKQGKLTLTIKGEGSFVFPSYVVISKYKSMPLKRGDGELLFTAEESTEIKGSHTIDIPVSALREGTKLKLFFLNDKNYKSFKIACQAGNTI